MAISCDPATLANAARCFDSCSHGPLAVSVKTYLLCQIATVGIGPATPGNIDLSNASVSGNTIITWTNSDTPDTNEVWKSTDGVNFVLLTSVAGTTQTATDVAAMAGNTMFSYKVRGVKAGAPSSFTSVVAASLNLTPALRSLPTLVLAYGTLNLSASAGNSVDAPLLRKVYGTFTCSSGAVVTTVNLPALVSVGGIFDFSTNASMAALSLPALVLVVGNFTVAGCTALTSMTAALLTEVNDLNVTNVGALSLTLPSLNKILGTLTATGGGIVSMSFPILTQMGNGASCFNCAALVSFSIGGACVVQADMIVTLNPALASVSIPNTTFPDGFNVDFSGCAIVVGNSAGGTGIDGILRRGVVSATTTSDYELAAGTNASPDATGLVDKGALIGAGNIVNTN